MVAPVPNGFQLAKSDVIAELLALTGKNVGDTVPILTRDASRSKKACAASGPT